MKNNSVHQDQARPEPMPHLIDEGSGIDIQRREGGTNWPKRWRVRLIRNKNERDHQRVTAYGDTLPEAMSAAQVAFSLDGMAQGLAAPQSVEVEPELGSREVNEACWAFIEAMPHSLPGPIWNNVKPAVHAAICKYLKLTRPAQAVPQAGEADLADLCERIGRHLGASWIVIGPDGSRFLAETPLRAANEANKHRGRLMFDPAKAQELQAAIDQIRADSAAENDRLLAMYGSLNCPTCGGSGHVGDVEASQLTSRERCHADRDGDCRHADCPQLRDGEPRATGRHCPLDVCDSVPGAAPQPPAQAENQALTYSSTQATKCAGCGEHKHTPLRIDAMGGYVCLSCIDKKLSSLLGEFGYPQAEAVQQPSRTRLKPLPVERDMFGRVLGVRVGPALFPVSVVREIEGALGIGTEIASDRRQIQTASHPMRRACDWPQIDGEG